MADLRDDVNDVSIPLNNARGALSAQPVSDFVRGSDRGSALLIVFVFAAIIAITLYVEMPVYVFEARRQKEELLIDRGNEYKHAIRLFVRRLGSYPPSLEALQNTNNMRFLRHRFVDPFTKNDDWRLLHAGPGGILLDSKIPAATINVHGANSAAPNDGSAAPIDQTGDAGEERAVKALPTHPPAISANSGAQQSADGPAVQQDSTEPLLAPGVAAQLADNSPTGIKAQATLQLSQMPGNSLSDHDTSQPAPLSGGPVFGGGIAGVASMAPGHSIKVWRNQTDYSLWEFAYDPAEDLLLGLVQLQNGSGGGLNINGTGAPGTVASPLTNDTP
jgi:hypothetical protein